jgi:hypothetical protein
MSLSGNLFNDSLLYGCVIQCPVLRNFMNDESGSIYASEVAVTYSKLLPQHISPVPDDNIGLQADT